MERSTTQAVDESNARWTVDKKGNIHFAVTSDGTSKAQWEDRLNGRPRWFCDLLRNASDAPTNGVTYNVVVRPGQNIRLSSRKARLIRAAATRAGWQVPHWEVAFLIREAFTNEELVQMGFYRMIVMHKPIKKQEEGGRDDVDYLFALDHDCGDRALNVYYAVPPYSDFEHSNGSGFAFVK